MFQSVFMFVGTEMGHTFCLISLKRVYAILNFLTEEGRRPKRSTIIGCPSSSIFFYPSPYISGRSAM